MDTDILTPERALIFRITHRNNVPWIMQHGVHCTASEVRDPGFVSIGKAALIDARSERQLGAPCKGPLRKHVPFYFTPWSPMLLNILTGRQGVNKRERPEIVVLVSSLHRLRERGVQFVFSDRHAYLRAAQFSDALGDLERWVPWELLRAKNFARNPDRPDDFEQYQAEALVLDRVPIDALLGVATYDERTAAMVRSHLPAEEHTMYVTARPRWYFES